jgi:peptidoglycan/xylan/chitin deacetylase (PgdA/CDA1 family)
MFEKLKEYIKDNPAFVGLLAVIIVLFIALFAVLRGDLHKPTEPEIERSGTEYPGVDITSVYVNDKNYVIHATVPTTDNSKIDDTVEDFTIEKAEYFVEEADEVIDAGRRTVEDNSKYELNQSFEVNQNSEDYVSFRFLGYEYKLDPNLDEYVQTYIFDKSSGDSIPLEMLFKTDSDYLEVLSEVSREQLYSVDGAKQSEVDRGTEPKTENFEHYVPHEGKYLLLSFDQGQVVPAEDGIPESKIDLVEYRDITNPEMMKALFPVVYEAIVADEENVEPPVVEPTPPEIPVAPPIESHVDCSQKKCISITFDDGPHTTLTPRLLDYLNTYKAKATFFVIGNRVAYGPEILRRAVLEGHEVGIHTWSHAQLTNLSGADIEEQITLCNEAIYQATGVQPTLYRPPYGAVDERVQSFTNMPAILWSVDPKDWNDLDSTIVYNRVIENASPGAIILMHDIHETSVEAVPAILQTLSQQGYTFVTVSDLLGFSRNPAEVPTGGIYTKGIQ